MAETKLESSDLLYGSERLKLFRELDVAWNMDSFGFGSYAWALNEFFKSDSDDAYVRRAVLTPNSNYLSCPYAQGWLHNDGIANKLGFGPQNLTNLNDNHLLVFKAYSGAYYTEQGTVQYNLPEERDQVIKAATLKLEAMMALTHQLTHDISCQIGQRLPASYKYKPKDQDFAQKWQGFTRSPMPDIGKMYHQAHQLLTALVQLYPDDQLAYLLDLVYLPSLDYEIADDAELNELTDYQLLGGTLEIASRLDKLGFLPNMLQQLAVGSAQFRPRQVFASMSDFDLRDPNVQEKYEAFLNDEYDPWTVENLLGTIKHQQKKRNMEVDSPQKGTEEFQQLVIEELERLGEILKEYTSRHEDDWSTINKDLFNVGNIIKLRKQESV